jgi:aspartyl/asparaginyl beta-hydroxylase (cupin superfamily)
MTVWNLHGKETSAHLPFGTAWYLDARKPHAVVNETSHDRIHLVVDVLADETTRRAIREGKDIAA